MRLSSYALLAQATLQHLGGAVQVCALGLLEGVSFNEAGQKAFIAYCARNVRVRDMLFA